MFTGNRFLLLRSTFFAKTDGRLDHSQKYRVIGCHSTALRGKARGIRRHFSFTAENSSGSFLAGLRNTRYDLRRLVENRRNETDDGNEVNEGSSVVSSLIGANDTRDRVAYVDSSVLAGVFLVRFVAVSFGVDRVPVPLTAERDTI